MRIILAPMHGITDFYVRQVLTAIGGFDLCVTEFLRVTESLFPAHVFYKTCPEINPDNELFGKTTVGVPVFLQLLGNHVDYLAANAFKASQLGAQGIDLNFGCPAKTVNGHGGGAVLLKHPEHIYQIVSAVKKALPAHTPLSAKIRLGYEDSSLLLENALAIEQAGADFITVHARTKLDAYLPLIKWAEVKPLFNVLKIPIVLNGEIWSVEDYLNCQQQSSATDVMLGRGAFVCPDLALQIKAKQDQQAYKAFNWQQVQQLLLNFCLQMQQDKKLSASIIAGRLKLWVKWLMATYDEAVIVFEKIKSLKQLEPMLIVLLEA